MNDDRRTSPPAITTAKTFPDAPAGDTPPHGSQVVQSDTSLTIASEISSEADQAPKLARLKHYRLLELIGRGGMGDVYRAQDEQFNRTVAVKVLPADLASDRNFVYRFQREAQALAKLAHPNIVPIYTIDEDQGHYFFAMQFVAGESLDRRLRRARKLPLTATLRIISQCLEGLQAAHDQQLVHRDVKPGNVLLQQDTQQVFLVDFGLVRRVDSNSMFTVSGMVMGTVDYMSPEQARGMKGIDHRSDLYSVGVMLYHMLAGRLPFESPTFEGMLYNHAYETPFPLEIAAPDTPEALVALVQRLIAKEPSERPQSCREVLDAIAPLLRLEFRAQRVEAELQEAADPAAQPATPGRVPREYHWPQRWRDRAASLFGRRRPAWLKELQATHDEVDSALGEVERRVQQLHLLKAEGEQLCSELQDAADCDDGRAQAHGEQAASIVQMLPLIDRQLADAAALRARLARGREAIGARLRYVQARKPDRRRIFGWQVAAAAVLVAAGALAWVVIARVRITSDDPPPVAEPLVAAAHLWQDLAAPVNCEQDMVFGTSARGPDGIRFGSNGRHLLKLPQALPDNYDLECEFTKSHGGEGIELVIPVGDRLCNAYFGAWGGGFHGIYRVRGADRFAGAHTSGTISPNKRYRALVRVRRNGDTATIALVLDAARIVTWTDKVAAFSLHPEFSQAPHGQVSVSTFNVDLTLHTARWRPSPEALEDQFKSQRISAPQSISLLPLADLADAVVMGKWQRDERGALIGTSDVIPEQGHARIQLPARPAGDYKLIVRFARLHKGSANVVFPVGDTSARATFGQSIVGSLVARSDGQGFLGIDDAVRPTSSTGGTHEAHIVVRHAGRGYHVQIYLDGTLTCDWRGAGEMLENNPPCSIPDRSAIGLTAWGEQGARFESVVLEMLSGFAEIGHRLPFAQPTSSALEVDQLLQRANEHWQQGELTLARAGYERMLALSPTAHVHRGILAALCLALGDDAEYRRHCQHLLSHIDEEQQPHERLSTLRIAFLVPGSAQVLSESKQQQMFDAERSSEWKDRVTILWHYRHGRWQEAIELADSYLAGHALWRERAQCMVLRAMALHQAGQPAEAANALADVQRYVASQDAKATKWNEAANAIYLQIFYREATELLRGKREDLSLKATDVEKIEPSSRLLQSRDKLDADIAASPNNPDRYINRGHWYAARHMWREACEEYEQALRLRADMWWCRTGLARAYLFLGDLKAYKQHCEFLVRQLDSGPDVGVQVHLMRPLCLAPEQWGTEIDEYSRRVEQFLTSNPGHGEALRTIIELRYAQGRWHGCIEAVNELVPDGLNHVFDGYPWLYRIMAMHQLGQSAAAKRELQDFKTFMERQRWNTPWNEKYGKIPAEKRIKPYLFNSLEAQIVYRRASLLILGQTEELKIAPAIEPSSTTSDSPPALP